jgi:hypothetical protein
MGGRSGALDYLCERDGENKYSEGIDREDIMWALTHRSLSLGGTRVGGRVGATWHNQDRVFEMNRTPHDSEDASALLCS